MLRHLQACDGAFHPPLSSRVDLADYAGKLCAHATRFEAWHDDDLVGLVAVYCNAPDRGTAFVSNVSALPSFTGQGIARHLMGRAITHLHDLGFSALMLEVDPAARFAQRLYAGLGFRDVGRSATGLVTMTLTLTHMRAT